MSPNERQWSLTVARLQVYVAITCYKLPHEATWGEEKNSLMECKDILVSDRDVQRFFSIIQS